ncbi:MAG: DUF4921 family protein [Candidatus Jorgensenbacteria bacterium]
MRNPELRQDLVSGDWILISPKRSKKPHSLFKRKKRGKAPVKNCPFENILKTHKPISVYNGGRKGDWEVAVVENKYPAVVHKKNACARSFRHGIYSLVGGVGHHDIVVTRDHNRNFANLNPSEANQVFQAFRDRYTMLLDDPCLAYILIFHNWGPTAGASVYHPHYQLIAVPVVPPDIRHSLTGSSNYFKKYRRCVHCEMIKIERKEKKRIVFENDNAIVFAPFVSREPFELRIFPKKHSPYFEDAPDAEIESVVSALQFSLKKIEKKLGDPDYNFFIHTAPVEDKGKYRHYHWHLEIIPKTNISAGFELGTGIEINVMDPDDAARILRK